MSGLNPQVRKIEVGVRELREEHVYPLSMADQIALPEKLISAFNKFSELDYSDITKSVTDELLNKATDETSQDMEAVRIGIEIIKENIDYLLEKSTDGVTTADLTNDQFVEIVDILFTINYEGSVGKALDLVKRVKSLFSQAKA
jgi:hypothetical protein